MLVFFLFAACGRAAPGNSQEQGVSVVTTIFPPYDFVRAVSGGKVHVTMLLKPGAESHSYEPSPQDIISIRNCAVFICVGGESEDWVDRVLNSMDEPALAKKTIIRLMDCVDVVEEEIIEGMEEEEKEAGEETEKEYDEHVWTAPQNVKLIMETIAAALCETDPANAVFYRENAAVYAAELDTLDEHFRAVTASAVRKTLVFGDRFPFRYFADAYGLDYYAAFPGCSTETEPSAATVAFLINKVRSEHIPVVFHIEFSNELMADAICEASGAKKRLLHSVHNVSRDDRDAGLTYLDLMNRNAEALKEALN
jgi:zinc transport system substrate-binding protein